MIFAWINYGIGNYKIIFSKFIMLSVFIREYSSEEVFILFILLTFFKGQLLRKNFRSKHSLLHPLELSVLGVCMTFDWGTALSQAVTSTCFSLGP